MMRVYYFGVEAAFLLWKMVMVGFFFNVFPLQNSKLSTLCRSSRWFFRVLSIREIAKCRDYRLIEQEWVAQRWGRGVAGGLFSCSQRTCVPVGFLGCKQRGRVNLNRKISSEGLMVLR